MTAFPVQIHDYLEAARGDERLFLAARKLFHARDHFERSDEKKVAITASDAGRCAAQVQAEIRGEYDLPDADFGSRDAGTLRGAWAACLLGAAIEDKHDDVSCLREETRSYDGVSGHADLTAYALDALGMTDLTRCLWVVEIKTTASFTVRPPHVEGKTVPNNIHQAYQACQRALAHGAPIFTVYTMGPGDAFDQSDYPVDYQWTADTRAEYERLRRGEKDARRDYQCAGCQWSKCEKNPRAPERPLLELLEASL